MRLHSYLRRHAPGLYALLSFEARRRYGRGLEELSPAEARSLAASHRWLLEALCALPRPPEPIQPCTPPGGRARRGAGHSP